MLEPPAMGFNIADLFERAVDAVPERLALVCGDRRLTYAEFEEEANRLANHLIAEGFGHGDHIGIYGQNSAEWLVAMVAIFKIRAVPININFRYVEDELAYLFDNADLVALVHDREYIDRIEAVHRQGPRACATSSRSTTAATSTWRRWARSRGRTSWRRRPRSGRCSSAPTTTTT